MFAFRLERVPLVWDDGAVIDREHLTHSEGSPREPGTRVGRVQHSAAFAGCLAALPATLYFVMQQRDVYSYRGFDGWALSIGIGTLVLLVLAGGGRGVWRLHTVPLTARVACIAAIALLGPLLLMVFGL